MARQFVERLARQRGVELPKGDIFSESAVKPGKGKTASGKKGQAPEPAKPAGPPLPPPRLIRTIKPPTAHGGDAGEAHVDSHEPPPVVETAPASPVAVDLPAEDVPAAAPPEPEVVTPAPARVEVPAMTAVAPSDTEPRVEPPAAPEAVPAPAPAPVARHPWPRLQPRRRRRESPPVASCRRACASGSRNPARPCRRRGRSLRRSVRRASRRRGLSRRLPRRARVLPGSAPGSVRRWARARRTPAAVPIPRPRRRLVARARCPRSRCARGSPVCRPVRVSPPAAPGHAGTSADGWTPGHAVPPDGGPSLRRAAPRRRIAPDAGAAAGGPAADQPHDHAG